MKKPLTITLTAIAVLLGIQTHAQPVSAGIFNSLKGIGATVELPHGTDEFTSLSAFVEIFGIPTGRCDKPGGKFNFSHNFIFRKYDNDATLFELYAGPGLSAGYMRDFEVGKRVDTILKLTDTPGLMAALSGRAGCRFSFEKRIALNLSFTAEFGIHARRDRNVNNINVRMYHNGLLQCLYPELSILVQL